jgi:hypothetical protein
VEALEMDSANHHHVGGTMEQRRNKLDVAIMSANPFNSVREIGIVVYMLVVLVVYLGVLIELYKYMLV